MPNPRRSPPPLQALLPLPIGAPFSDWVWVTVPNYGHPGFGESLIPVWGAEKEAIADYYDSDVPGALFNAGLAAVDVLPVEAAGKTALEGGFRLGAKSWKAERRALGRSGFAKPGQPVHHAFIPQKAKAVAPEIRNSPLNLKPMPSAEVHARIHGSYKGKPQFNPLQQFFYGTPTGFQFGLLDAAGHAALQAMNSRDRRKR